MKRTSIPWLRAGLAGLPIAILSACGGGGGGGDSAAAPQEARVTEAVPAAVVSSPTKATGYTRQLADTPPAEGDTLEPVSVPDQIAADDTAEPA